MEYTSKIETALNVYKKLTYYFLYVTYYNAVYNLYDKNIMLDILIFQLLFNEFLIFVLQYEPKGKKGEYAAYKN